MTAAWQIAEMQSGHLATVADLELSCYQSPWSAAAFEHELQNNPFARNYVATGQGSGLAGYACIWLREGELLINNLTVASAFRRQGLGRHLLGHLMEVGRHAACHSAVLEVRPSNEAALHLYRSFDFEQLGSRPGYYRDGEDALILGRTLLEPSR